MQTNLQRPQRLFVQPVRYEIPAFQRRYVWKQEEQWEPLWDDVEALAQTILEDGRSEPHFMGAVVFQQRQFAAGTIERRIVVDGQQRLTTLQLLIDAIQEVLEARQHTVQAERLSDLVVNGAQYRNGNPDLAFKVWPTVVDRAAFRCAMSNELSAAGHTSSRVVQAHEFFRGQTEQWLDRFSGDGGQDERAASALESAVSGHLEIVVIDLGDSDNPHVIFETLNARGTPLLQSDMVKNKVLHDAEVGLRDDDDEASDEEKRLWPFDQDNWWAQEVGRGLQRRPRVDVYLNHWLTLRNRAEMKPYDEFRAFATYADGLQGDDASVKDTVKAVAKDMGALGGVYRDVEDIRRADVAKFLQRRNVMNVGVVTPLLLWLLSEDLATETLANCVKALESFLVRRVICGYSARGYGELFVGLIDKLAGDSVCDADRVLISHLREQRAQATLWPRDAELRERFITAPLYQYLTRGRLRMVLEGIEEALRTNKAESGDVPSNLHIEHVMPQTWHSNWPLPDDAEDEAVANRDQMIHTVGNLTLVNGRLNSSLSNAPWDSKRKTLCDHSVLFLNKRLVNKGPDDWDESAIKKRGKWLHKRAIEVWPYGADIQPS
ncbi:MAG: DUF262 domain-containing HNH endonuclease family protein [Rhodospirillaceae bacterium]|nr:DUF262 domain-containing HNH endonuclease family protein [Rhodospirillaceae bacterium]